MSYRNPGDIRIADPNAFMRAFEAKAGPAIEKLKQRKEERKKEAEQYDKDLAAFNQSMNYPEWAKTINADAANSIKSMINKNYIDNGRFKNATASERQEILDEININIGQDIAKINSAIQLSANEILPGDFEDNPEFLQFIKTLPGQEKLNVTEIDGKTAFTYQVNGETKVLSSDKIPDGIANYTGRQAIQDKYAGLFDQAVSSIDKTLAKREELSLYDAQQIGDAEARSIFNGLDDREKNFLFEKAQIDINGDEEGGVIAYSDIKDLDEETRKAAEAVVIENIKGEIENKSIEIGRIKSDEIVRRQRAAEKQQSQTGEKMTIKEEVSNFIVQFNSMVNKGTQNPFIDFAQRTLPGLIKSGEGYIMGTGEDQEFLTEDQLIATLADFYSKNPAAFANARNSVMNTSIPETPAEPQKEAGSTDWNQFKVN